MPVNGAYFAYSDLRQIALAMAIESADEFGTDHIVDRAESYFLFLIADLPATKSEIPS